MGGNPFIDYYEILQVSPNVDQGTVERVFRYLAKRYHPDNQQTGNPDQFDLVVKAYRELIDDERRAAYDVLHQRHRSLQWTLAGEAADTDDLMNDQRVRERILSLLYVKIRRDLRNPGLGAMDIEKILDRPREHLEFHLWYLRQKGWIERTESGHLALTVDGVEQVEANQGMIRPDRLIENRSGEPRMQRAK